MTVINIKKVPPLYPKKKPKIDPENLPYVIQSFKDRVEYAKTLPEIKQIIGSLVAEEELTILFGRSGAGKTALAMQIGIAAAKGQRLFTDLVNEAGPLKVLYYDAEMQDRQILDRVSLDNYLLPENFDFMKAKDDYEGPEHSIIIQLQNVLEGSDYKFIIIDNLHTLGERLEESGKAREIMMQLKKIVVKNKVTLLVIAHTPNIPETCKIESSMMQGSEVLKVFLDQQIAIGNSIINDSTKYIKVLKSRNRKNDYHSKNVITTEIIKDNDFLVHDFKQYDSERLHYNEAEQKNKDLEDSVLNVNKQNPEFSSREIVESCEDAGVTVGKDKVLSILKANGIELKKAGRKPK